MGVENDKNNRDIEKGKLNKDKCLKLTIKIPMTCDHYIKHF